LQFERYSFLSHCLLSGNKSLMLVGEQGCGKTSLVQNLVQTEIDMTKISISPGQSIVYFEDYTQYFWRLPSSGNKT